MSSGPVKVISPEGRVRPSMVSAKCIRGGSVLFSNQFRTFFRNPSNYSKGLTHFAKMAVSVVQVLGFDPFSNSLRTFFKHNCRARVHPPFSCASHVQCQDASHVQCQVPLRGILLFLVGGEGGATGGEPSPGARGGPCAACDCPPAQGPAQTFS